MNARYALHCGKIRGDDPGDVEGEPPGKRVPSVDFVLQEHGYHTKDPKVSKAGGSTREIKRAMEHGNGRLNTSESTPHDKERHRSDPGLGPSW
jgi:hypothetical protein